MNVPYECSVGLSKYAQNLRLQDQSGNMTTTH
jgi:hypothetical protein